MATGVTPGAEETVCNDADVEKDVPTKEIDCEEYPWAKRILDKTKRHGTHANEETRLILIGATGAGKSESGNTILSVEGDKSAWFEAGDASEPVTKESKNRKNKILGRMVSVTDTPGTGNKDQQAKEICNQIRAAVTNMKGFHAIIYVISIFKDGLRLDQEQLTTLKKINEYLGDRFYNYGILLFTYGSEFVQRRKAQAGDTVRPSGDDLHTYLEEDLAASHDLRTSYYYSKFHKRAVLFENRDENQEHKKIMVENLMFLVDEIQVDMNNEPFTKDHLPPDEGKAKEKIPEKEEKIPEKEEKIPEKEEKIPEKEEKIPEKEEKGSWSSKLPLFFAALILSFAILLGEALIIHFALK